MHGAYLLFRAWDFLDVGACSSVARIPYGTVASRRNKAVGYKDSGVHEFRYSGLRGSTKLCTLLVKGVGLRAKQSPCAALWENREA